MQSNADKILDEIELNTFKFSRRLSKLYKKSIGQFFTPKDIAMYMASLCNQKNRKLCILDPGSGTGMLSSTLAVLLISTHEVKEIDLTLYEMDEKVIEVLEKNMLILNNFFIENNKMLKYNIIQENFIISNSDNWHKEDKKGGYDIVIANPPYKKLKKTSAESEIMIDIVFGQPNLYFLFMAMSLKLLKENGELVFITPRSYFSGAYFSKFRKWFIKNSNIEKIHLFHSRNKIFLEDQVRQEIVITKVLKCRNQNKEIYVSESYENIKKETINTIKIQTKMVIESSENKFIRIPVNTEEYESIKIVDSWNYNLIKLGYRMSTGPVVDFRNKEFIKSSSGYSCENEVPLIRMENLKKNRVVWSSEAEMSLQSVLILKSSIKILIPNSNYLLLKRFTTKEENKRLQCAIYYKNQFKVKYIGIENHVNYIRKKNGRISKVELLGFFILFNSNILDKYFRVLNGNTQVNANEVNFIPMPGLGDIIKMGTISMNLENLDSNECDKIVKSILIK